MRISKGQEVSKEQVSGVNLMVCVVAEFNPPDGLHPTTVAPSPLAGSRLCSGRSHRQGQSHVALEALHSHSGNAPRDTIPRPVI